MIEIIDINPGKTREIANSYYRSGRNDKALEALINDNIPDNYILNEYYHISVLNSDCDFPIIRCKVRKKSEDEIYKEQLEYFIGNLGTIEVCKDKKIEKQLTLLSEGRCLDCGMPTKDWEPMFGSFAPEWWASMRERGIDPATGHKFTCKHI